MSTTATKSTKGYSERIVKTIRRRMDVINLVLFITLIILLLLDFHKGWFGSSGGNNYEIFISAAITGSVAALAIIIPLRIQKLSAIRTFSMVVSSELYRNLSELEYAEQEFNKDYHQQPPVTGNPTPRDKQTMEMSKIMGAAARLDAAIENAAYNGMLSSRIIADIDQSVAQKIIEAYSGIASARRTTKHFADFFSRQMDFERIGAMPEFTEYIRKNQVDKSIQMVKEDVCVAIKQTNLAIDALNKELKQYGQQYKPVYRDELVKKYNCGKPERRA